MDGVDLTHVETGALREPLGIESFEMVLGWQFPEHVVQGLFDEGSGAEMVAALRDVHGAEFASPRIDVLEYVPVDGP